MDLTFSGKKKKNYLTTIKLIMYTCPFSTVMHQNVFCEKIRNDESHIILRMIEIPLEPVLSIFKQAIF